MKQTFCDNQCFSRIKTLQQSHHTVQTPQSRLYEEREENPDQCHQ